MIPTKTQSDSIDPVELREILKLSITSLLILQVLHRSGGALRRTELLENLNAYLGADDLLVTQTFYNQIDKLNEKGYITSTLGRTGKIDTIKTTSKTVVVLDKISEITFFGTININDYVKDLFESLLEKSNITKVNSLLLINLEEGLDVRAIDILENISDSTFIASSDESYQRYKARNIAENIQQSKIIDGKIREPDNIFDITSLVGYECGRDYYNYPERNWLMEAVRVTKPGGLVFVSSVEEVPKSNHFLIDHIVNKIEHIEFIKQLNQEDLKKELSAAHLENIQIISHKGILVGIGTKTIDI